MNGMTAVKSGRKLDSRTIQKFAAFLSLIIMTIFFSIASPYFFNLENLLTVALQTSVIGFLAIGVTFVIITGGIDLSLGSVLAIAGVSLAMATNAGVPLWLGIVIGLAVGSLFGAAAGVLVVRGGIAPFIATLGLSLVARGLALVFTSGIPLYFANVPGFSRISQGELFGVIPYPVIYLFVLAGLASFMLRRMSIGRYTYAVGSNEEAARLSGINVGRVKMTVYTFNGLMAGVAGVVLAARLNSAQPAIGSGYELDAIAAAVIGGTSLSGGEGTILGTMIGAFIMSVLKNGLNLMQVSQFWQQVIMGVVVIGAVYLDTARKRR